MNYRKLLFFGLIMASLASQGTFGMQKQGQFADFKNQALSWISEHKTGILIGSCALAASYGLYRYFSKPEALEKRIKNNKAHLELALKTKFEDLKNDAPYMDFHVGIQALTLPKNNGYVAGYVMVKNPETQQYKFLVIFQDKADKKNLMAYRYAGNRLEQASPQEIGFLQGQGLLQSQNNIAS